MKPRRSILDRSFEYVPAVSTSVAETWRRFGWRPTTPAERELRYKVGGRSPGRGRLVAVALNADYVSNAA